MARRATAIAQLRKQAQGGVLVLDSGNCFAASPGSSLAADGDVGMLIVRAMNAMGYDALALGPMDVAPLPLIEARFQEADFAILSANVEAEGVLPNVQPYLIKETGGHTIAIVGATNERIGQQRFQESGLSLSVESAVVAVQRAVQKVRKQANVVVVLSNLGGQANEALAQEIPGIDAIIGAFGGRQNKEVAGPEGLVVLRAAGTRGEYLGLLRLRFDDDGRVIDFESRQVALTPDYAEDPRIARMIREWRTSP